MSDPIAADGIDKAWTFETKAVASGFDGHVRAHIPWYDLVSRYVADLAVSFLPSKGVLYDLGCSTGNITRLMQDDLEAKRAKVVSLDPSAEMIERFAGYGEALRIGAERFNFEHERPNVIVMFLVLMFLDPAWRFQLLRRLARGLQPGGALFIVDKTLVIDPRFQVANKAAMLAEKLRSGVPAEAYVQKELSLRGQQIPIDLTQVRDLLVDAGLVVEEFFLFGEFAGLIAIKSET